jgi:sugar phosphate isomerase/epimerase
MNPVHLFQQSYSYRFHYQYQPGFDVFSFIEIAAADGFTGVSINANGPGYRQLSGTTPAHFRAVRHRLQQHGLLCDLETSDTAPAHIETMLEVCSALGAGQLRTYMRHEGSLGETIAQTITDLAAVARLAEQAGTRVLLENHEDFTGPELAHILSAVDSPWIGALFDYGNSMMVGEEPMTALAAIRPFVRSAHLKDHACVLVDGAWWIVGTPIGDGVLPILDLTRELVAAGLDRIIFSSVWAYKAPLRARRGNAVPGQGVFRATPPPFDPLLCPFDSAGLAALDPARLVDLEGIAARRGQDWLRHALGKNGIALRSRFDRDV